MFVGHLTLMSAVINQNHDTRIRMTWLSGNVKWEFNFRMYDYIRDIENRQIKKRTMYNSPSLKYHMLQYFGHFRIWNLKFDVFEFGFLCNIINIVMSIKK